MECGGCGAAAGTRPLMGHAAASAGRKHQGSRPDTLMLELVCGDTQAVRAAAVKLPQQVSPGLSEGPGPCLGSISASTSSLSRDFA